MALHLRRIRQSCETLAVAHRFGAVIDRKTLNKLLVSVASVFVAIGSFVVALQPGTPPPADATGIGVCTVMNAAQEAALASFRAANQSCVYNISVDNNFV